MALTHKHHIIPIHVGGSDDPSNLIELTIPEHAEAHRILYEKHGRWQDKLAWHMLSGQIGKGAGQKEIGRQNGLRNKGRKHSEEICRRNSLSKMGRPGTYGMLGKKHDEQTKIKIREGNKGKIVSEETRNKMSKAGKKKIFTAEHKRKLSEAKKGNTHTKGRKFSLEHKENLKKARKKYLERKADVNNK